MSNSKEVYISLDNEKKSIVFRINMIIGKEDNLANEFLKRAGENCKKDLDSFFIWEDKDLYIVYTRATLDDIIKGINCYNDSLQDKVTKSCN